MENNRPNKVPITRLTKFFDDIDFDLEIGFGREYMEGDLNMTIILYSVDIERTDSDDVYKEVRSQDIRYFPPVEIQVNLEIAPAENQTYNSNGTLRYRDYGNMTFNVYQKQLDEKLCEIKYGDYIGYAETEDRMRYYVVTNDGRVTSDLAHTIGGYKPFYRTITCSYVSPDEFKGI